ncbi:hypothetical protein ACFXGA_27035 [Actinosynnema sp. NPDC059335]|uniref:hypothetical protein n=1 Tax=Actinosynnema sp. NPDC059335 TaxID=3346804 RepID=UPI003672E2D7
MTNQQRTHDTGAHHEVEETVGPDDVDYDAMSPQEQDDYDRLNDGPRVGWDGELYDADGNPL